MECLLLSTLEAELCLLLFHNQCSMGNYQGVEYCNLPSKSLFLSLQSGVFHGLLQEAQGNTGTKDAKR